MKTFSYKGKTHNFSKAPKWVRFEIKLTTDRWGQDLTGVQGYVIHKALDLAGRFGEVAT